MKITLPYPPSANAYWRIFKNRILVSQEARQYKASVKWRALGARIRPVAKRVCVTVSVFRPRAIGDLDNTLKVLLDSLRGVAFDDDSQVTELHAYRFDDKANPRAEVTVETMKTTNEDA